MKHIALAALLALATTTATVRNADACGGGGGINNTGLGSLAAVGLAARETAVGIWPKMTRDRRGAFHLRLGYPKFTLSGQYLYGADFVLAPDANLRRFQRALDRPGAHQLEVTLEETSPGSWRVVRWARRA